MLLPEWEDGLVVRSEAVSCSGRPAGDRSSCTDGVDGHVAAAHDAAGVVFDEPLVWHEVAIGRPVTHETGPVVRDLLDGTSTTVDERGRWQA
jgi:hypothetical protein